MQNDRDVAPRAYTIEGFKRAYSIGHTKTYELINAGKLRIKKEGKRTLILADSAEAWLNGDDAKAA